MRSQKFHVELLEWIQTFPYWKQFLACKILLDNQLKDSALDDAFQFFLQEHDLNEGQETIEKVDFSSFLESDQERQITSHQDLRLKTIKDFKAISALKDGQQIALSPQLTVLFGENGAGKSSYVRLFNNAFASRGETEILPNIYREGSFLEPSCTFEFEKEGTCYCIGYPAERDNEEFELFTVFDSKSVRVHLDEKNEFLFMPSGFEFFNFLINGLDRLSNRLNEAIQQRSRENPFRTRFPKERPVGQFIHNLTSQSTFEELNELANYSKEDEQAIQKYEKERAKLVALEVEEQLKEEQQFLDALDQFRQKIIVLNENLSGEKIQAINDAVTDVNGKCRLVEQSGEEQFKKLGQNHAGTDEWKAFINAAFTFVNKYEENYPSEESSCPFCGQPLEKEARTLVKNYWAFLKSTAEEDLKRAESTLNVLKEEIRHLNFSLLDESSYLYHKLNTSEETRTDLNSWKDELAKIRVTYEKLINTVEQGRLYKETVTAFNLIPLESTINKVKHRLKKLAEKDPAERIKELGELIAENTDKQLLKDLLPEIREFLQDLKWTIRASTLTYLFNTRGTTMKQTAFFEKYVAGDYLDIFKKECETLKANFEIDVHQQGRKGNTLRELKIKGHNLKQVLSEGEQRAISLADFLTEIQVSSANKGIMFDDPVNSLDHIRKKCIADRLVKESLSRQVVIFTHDLMFLSYLKESSNESTTDFLCHWIQKTEDGAGLVFLNNSPSNESDYKSAKTAREFYKKAKDASPEDQEIFLKHGFGALRTNYEAFVIFDLFNEVVLRFNERISIGRLKDVVVNQEVVEEVIKKTEELSRYIEGHLHSDAYVHNKPTPQMLMKEIEAFESLKRRQKELKKELKQS